MENLVADIVREIYTEYERGIRELVKDYLYADFDADAVAASLAQGIDVNELIADMIRQSGMPF